MNWQEACREQCTELAEWSKKAYGEENPIKIAGIVCYEAGDVLRDVVRIEDYPDLQKLYLKQAKVSLGDVLAMSQLLCGMLGLNFDEVYKEGCQRAIDRCKEKLEGKDGF